MSFRAITITYDILLHQQVLIMPRKYCRELGSRLYHDYPEETLISCLQSVRNGMKCSEASAVYKIPVRTIYNKLSQPENSVIRPFGGQTIFSPQEESAFAANLLASSDFGFPLTKEDIRAVVRHYLLKLGRNVSKFRDGISPGPDWVNGFLGRHPEISCRVARNVKADRAAIDEKVLREYQANLAESLEGVPPELIFNYDETNITDNPGERKVLAKRGCKYSEVICNSTKTSISLMLCGNAAGDILPLYVVYKATRLWDTWTEQGPPQCRYNVTQSGWFDVTVFEDWFKKIFLPAVIHKPGKKVIIGDNLSSHFSDEVLQLCRSNDILFVCLPPNSTHLTQPLDVSFFGPMKRIWRKILRNWKLTGSGQCCKTLQKQDFPRLLKNLMNDLLVKGGENLRSGFRKCGIYPCAIEPLLATLPTYKVDRTAVDESFIEFLSSKRNDVTGNTRKRKRRTRVIPGRSVAEISSDESSEENVDDPDPEESSEVCIFI